MAYGQRLTRFSGHLAQKSQVEKDFPNNTRWISATEESNFVLHCQELANGYVMSFYINHTIFQIISAAGFDKLRLIKHTGLRPIAGPI
jgi:hypothetical protein